MERDSGSSPGGKILALPRLLDGLHDDLGRYVIPDLRSGEALERAEFSRQVIDRLAGDLLLDRCVAAEFVDRYAALIAAIDSAVGLPLNSISGEVSLSARPLVALRSQMTFSIRTLSTFETANPGADAPCRALWQSIRELEQALKQAVAACRALQATASPTASSADFSAGQLTEYLQARLPDARNLSITQLRKLPGGRSKTTLFASVSGYAAWPAEIVLRQDMQTGVVDTRHGATQVADEFPVLAAVAAAGLPVATPLWLEAGSSILGAPVMITARAAGVAPGDWRGFADPAGDATRAAVAHLAEVMGRLHSLDIRDLPLLEEVELSPERRMQREIDYRWAKWQRDTVEPSPLIESAFARLRRECRRGLGGPVLVHGDVLPHNLLVSEGRVTALLDWEFVHIGDPAEDLSYCRSAVTAVMPWQEFIDLYIAAGGKPVDERRLLIFGLWGLVRNCSFAASAARLHADGGTGDFTTGAIGYVSVPIMETHIAMLLEAMR